MTDPVVVCPSCARSFSARFATCPHCGWRVQSASGSNLPIIRDDDERITSTDLRAPDPSSLRLELPPDDEPPPLPGEGKATVRVPPAPRKGPPETARLESSDDEGLPPRIGSAIGRVELSNRVSIEEPSGAAEGHLELPFSQDSVVTTRTAPLPKSSAPRSPAPSRPSGPSWVAPEWLGDSLDPAGQLALVLVFGLALMAIVESLTVGRLEGGALLRGVVIGSLLVGAIAIGRLNRLGLIACGIGATLGLVMTGLHEALASVGLVLWLVAVVAVALSGRRLAWLAAGVLALALMAPCFFDGIAGRPVLGGLRGGPSLRTPFVDQQSGLQLVTIPPGMSLGSIEAEGARFEDRSAGSFAATRRLSSGATPTATREEAERWLSTLGLFKPVLGTEERLSGDFDAASLVPFSARAGRLELEGFLLVAHLGSEAFALAAWTRQHRAKSQSAALRALVATAIYRPPARLSVPLAQRVELRKTLVTTADGRHTGVRVVVQGAVVLLMPAGVPRALVPCASADGRFEVDFSSAGEHAGVVAVKLGGGGGAPLRRSASAPRLLRLAVLTGDSMAGGWLMDDPGPELRVVDLAPRLTGPAFDAEGHLVGVVSENGATLVTVDALSALLEKTAGAKPSIASASTETPPPLFSVVSEASTTSRPLADPSPSVLQTRSPGGPAAAVVITSTSTHWGLVVDSAVVPPGGQSVAVRLPDGTSRSASTGRSSERATLLVMPREPSDGLVAIDVVEGAPAAGRKWLWGFRDDVVSGTALRSIEGTLSADGFEADPGPAPSSGPLLGADGRMVGFAVSGSQRVIEPAALSALRLPAIRDAVFRIRAEASATCQLAADVELDDPLSEATTVRLRLEPAKGDSAPTRLTSAPIIDAVPSKGAASLLHRSPCFTSPHWLQFEVRGPTGSAFTKVRRVRSPTWLPEVIQGRAGPSPGALPPSQSLVLQLWALPAPVTRVHECRARLELCERACEVDQLDACALDGRYALEKKEPGRAVSRLDGPCAGGDVEACTLLLWAVVDKRPKGLRSNPEAVVAPWCEAGVARACSALDPKAWLKTLKAMQQQCGRVPSSCGALAKHLLAGPALDRDVAAAFVNLKKLCAAGDEGACTQSASESLRLETVDPVTVMPKISRGCAKRNAEACRLEAMNFANGYTQPRTGLGAENALETACRLGSAAACEMTYRP